MANVTAKQEAAGDAEQLWPLDREFEFAGWKRAKNLRSLLIAVSCFLLLVIGANVAMAVSVAELSKEAKVGRNGIMTMRDGKGFVATGQAATSVYLAEAYNLSINELRQITHVIAPGGDGSTSIYQVQQVTVNPGISVKFSMAGDVTLSIEENGMTYTSSPATGRRLLSLSTARGVSAASTEVFAPLDDYGPNY